MADGLTVITQADFSAGAFPGYEDVPPNGLEDIQDGFLRDDAAIERRGGTEYLSTSDLGTSSHYAHTLYAEYMPAVKEERIAGAWKTSAPSSEAFGLDSASAPVSFGGAWATTQVLGRPALVGGILIQPILVSSTEIGYWYWGGARRHLVYTTGTVTVTNNSATVTGAGTGWVVAGVAAGDVLLITNSGGSFAAVVKSVESATSLTLLDPWPYATAAGSAYTLVGVDQGSGNMTDFQSTLAPRAGTAPFVEVAGGRLLVGQGDTIWMSGFDSNGLSKWFDFSGDNFHRIPAGTVVTGLFALGNVVHVFTTRGAWIITNVAYDLTDDLGNAQQELQQTNPDLILWHDIGLVGWQGQIVAPALDDLYLFGQETRAITGGARKLYREYVKAGYRIGQAAVYRGHYFLPIMPENPAGYPIDVLVWRLDQAGPLGAPFFRWAGHAGQTAAFVASVGDQTREPRLLGGTGRRVTDLSGCLEPSASTKDDATGTAQQLKVTSRSIMLSETQDHTLRFGRLRYELDDAATDNPTFTAEWSRGRPGSAFTALTGSAGEGEDTYTWSLAKSGQQTRMRFTSNNAATRAIVRAMEFKVRQHGRT